MQIETLPPFKTEKLLNFLEELFQKKESLEFRNPVNYTYLGLTDYPKIIKTPMDLTTLKSNIQQDHYPDLKSALDDLQLIWDNCKLYNMNYSKIHKIALILEKFCEKKIKEIFGEISFGKNNASFFKLEEQKKQNYYEEEIEHNEKIEFTNRIRELEPGQLGQVVDILKDKCPRAFNCGQESDCEILVDNISKNCYEIVLKFFEELDSKKRIKVN